MIGRGSGIKVEDATIVTCHEEVSCAIHPVSGKSCVKKINK